MNSEIIDSDVDATAEVRMIKILNTLTNHLANKCAHCY